MQIDYQAPFVNVFNPYLCIGIRSIATLSIIPRLYSYEAVSLNRRD